MPCLNVVFRSNTVRLPVMFVPIDDLAILSKLLKLYGLSEFAAGRFTFEGLSNKTAESDSI